MAYDVTQKFGNFILMIQPWLIIIFILYFVAVGVWIAISEKARSMSTMLLIGGVVGMLIAFGAKHIGEALANNFKFSAIVVQDLLTKIR